MSAKSQYIRFNKTQAGWYRKRMVGSLVGLACSGSLLFMLPSDQEVMNDSAYIIVFMGITSVFFLLYFLWIRGKYAKAVTPGLDAFSRLSQADRADLAKEAGPLGQSGGYHVGSRFFTYFLDGFLRFVRYDDVSHYCIRVNGKPLPPDSSEQATAGGAANAADILFAMRDGTKQVVVTRQHSYAIVQALYHALPLVQEESPYTAGFESLPAAAPMIQDPAPKFQWSKLVLPVIGLAVLLPTFWFTMQPPSGVKAEAVQYAQMLLLMEDEEAIEAAAHSITILPIGGDMELLAAAQEILEHTAPQELLRDVEFVRYQSYSKPSSGWLYVNVVYAYAGHDFTIKINFSKSANGGWKVSEKQETAYKAMLEECIKVLMVQEAEGSGDL